MKRRTPKLIRFDASQVRRPTPAEARRMRRAASGPIDTTDIPEFRRLKRHGPIWHAIADGMQRQGLSGHALWKLARPFCPQMPESAVYEFLADKRSVRVEYADAMLQAVGVRMIAARKRRAG
jgi:hypothetical protein